MTEKANGWLKFAVALLPFFLVFIVAGITLNERVNNIQAVQATKADGAVVEVQYAAILREIRAMNERLDRMEVGR